VPRLGIGPKDREFFPLLEQAGANLKRGMEQAIDACEHAANLLEGICLKHS
jgi:hypothetical protein